MLAVGFGLGHERANAALTYLVSLKRDKNPRPCDLEGKTGRHHPRRRAGHDR